MSEILANASNVYAPYGNFNAVTRDQYNIFSHLPPAISQSIQRSERDKLLATLNPANGQNSYTQRCMEGTHQSILTDIDRWAAQTDRGVPNILLLTGSPGAGKSAIASSLVSKWRKEEKLGATFIFKHDNVVLSDPIAVWHSVAFDLAHSDEELGSVVVRALKNKTMDPTDSNIQMHFECLIEPMTRIENHRPVFIVFDALDECGWDDFVTVGIKRRVFLDTLAMFQHFLPSFKLVVTSCDECLSETFCSVCQHMTLHTGDAVTPETSLDIEHFFRRCFSEIHGLKVHQGVFVKLVAQAAGLFIWAETVVKFLDQKGAFPAQLLQLIMDDKFIKDPVYNLYRDILEISFQSADEAMLETVKTVLGAVVLAQVPLHCEDLQHLTEVELSSIESIIGTLSSVISNKEGRYLQINHFSLT